MEQEPKQRMTAGCAILAALLFGATAPLVKLLSTSIQPQLLAGVLYMGSGIGLGCWLLLRRMSGLIPSTERHLKRIDLPWLFGAILVGGIIAPVMLVFGLLQMSGSAASLALNFESVFTALLAWFVFKEHFDRRVAFGMMAIFAGGLSLCCEGLSPGSHALAATNVTGILLVSGACFFWALDNNLTRKISDADPVQIACAKGCVSGIVNVTTALCAGAAIPAFQPLLFAASVGFLGYGLSLVLFVLGLRALGTSRASAYFATAPFIGALMSVVLLHESITGGLIGAAALMSIGVWLHLTENHGHIHQHKVLEHEHQHIHDEHHRHSHESGELVLGAHSHLHKHDAMTHSHAHYPDAHHRHAH